MGTAKEAMLREEEQGWSSTDQYVCTNCVEDYALEEAIRAEHLPADTCDFCGHAPAAPLDVLLASLMNGFENEYEDAISSAPWDSAEGGYQVSPTWDTWDLIDDHAEVLVGDGLIDAVRAAVHERTWVERDWAWRRRDEVLGDSWNGFCHAVKHVTRYVFFLTHQPDEDESFTGEVSTTRILDALGSLVDQLGLVRSVSAGYRMWRAQLHDSAGIDRTAQRLGTAPLEVSAQANRMSPAGIPMFYGAESAVTAIREVAAGSEQTHVTWGCFEATTDFTILDLTAVRRVPSMFDAEWGRWRREFAFLHRFIEDVTKPVRSKYEQIDYVPTQVMTEYLLHVHKEVRPVGVLYRSALTHEPCIAVDVPAARCVDSASGSDSELRLVLLPDTIATRALLDRDKNPN